MNSEPLPSDLLSIRNLRIQFRRFASPPVDAVRGVDLQMKSGESIAVVGESGSGKSAMALSLARLLPEPTAQISADEMRIAGHEVLNLSESQLRKIRGSEIAYVFQEPTTSLNPVLTVRTQISEALSLHRPEMKDRDAEIVSWLYKVGISEPEKRLRSYPHELSGGMQQRVMIAMALCCHPKLLVADEPTTALDVTIQKQIMDLLAELRTSLNMSLMLITHNLGIVKNVADRILVMFRGQIVEQGPTESVLSSPQHPYTQALLDCVPRMGGHRHRLRTIDYADLDRTIKKARVK